MPNPWLITGVVTVAYQACFLVLSLLRYHNFHSRSFDLAIAVRTLWALRRGSFHEPFTNQPWSAYHFEPIMLPLALADGLLPTADFLLVLQTVALGLAAIPAHRLGARHLGAPWGGPAAALAVLLYPAVGHVNLFEFHPVALALAPGLALLDALDAGRNRLALGMALLVTSCREDGVVFVALALASVPAPSRRARWLRIGLGALCLLAFAIHVFVIVPRYGSHGSVRAHFGALGDTPAAVAWRLLRDPGALAAVVLTRENGVYLLQLLGPLAFLPLLAPRRALPALWTVAVGLLSPFSTVVDSHYTALAVPGLIAASVVGAAKLRLWAAARAPRLAPLPIALLLAAATVGQVAFGPLPGAGGFYPEDYAGGPRAEALRALVARIPAAPEVACSVPIDVVAHVARRERPDVFPAGVRSADFALVDLASQGVVGMSVEAYRARLAAQLGRAQASGMIVEARRGPLLLLRRQPSAPAHEETP